MILLHIKERVTEMLKILIVEDDPMVAKINQEFCESIDHLKVIKHVKDVNHAEIFLREYSCDLILLDVYLPGKSGLDFLIELRKKNCFVPVILITASDEFDTLEKAYAFGVIDYLIKPFSFSRFKVALMKVTQFYDASKNDERTNQSLLDNFFNIDNNFSQINTNQGYIQTDNTEKFHLDLPKGLSRLTLRKVYQAISQESEWFSTECIAGKVDISRISTKKYIRFMVEIGYLVEKMDYRRVGRPVTLYSKDKNEMEPNIIKKLIS